MPVAGPPVFLVPPGALTAGVMALTGPEGHHAAAVRRLRPGERADVSDGAGTLAEGVVTGVGKDSVTLDIHAVHTVPPPQPRLAVAQALPKGDRGELAVEIMTEVGVDVVVPWAAERCVARWRGARGERSAARWRVTAREAAKQARRARFPEITAQAETADAARLAAAASLAVVLDPDAAAGLRELPVPARGDIVVVVGPEGGLSASEASRLAEAGAVSARLGPSVLRSSSAGAVAAALLLSASGRWG